MWKAVLRGREENHLAILPLSRRVVVKVNAFRYLPVSRCGKAGCHPDRGEGSRRRFAHTSRLRTLGYNLAETWQALWRTVGCCLLGACGSVSPLRREVSGEGTRVVVLSSQGRAPRLGERVFVTPTATVVGNDERIRVADTAIHYVATKESARCGEDGP